MKQEQWRNVPKSVHEDMDGANKLGDCRSPLLSKLYVSHNGDGRDSMFLYMSPIMGMEEILCYL